MTEAEQVAGPELSAFASAAIRWDVASFGRWLRAGLDFWSHPQATAGQRAIAFRPLILDSERDPIAQVIDAATAIPGGLERLRDAGSEALATWTGESAHSGNVLGALLRLARRLPVASHVPALRRLLCEGFLEGQPSKDLLALEALETALKLVSLSEGEALLRELRRPQYWQPSFAATWLEGMTRANKIQWIEGLLELRDDLQKIDPSGRDLQPVLRRMARREGGSENLLSMLSTLPGKLDEWLKSALFSGERPPFTLRETRDEINKGMLTLTLFNGVNKTSIYDDHSKKTRDVIATLYEIQTQPRRQSEIESRRHRPSRGNGAGKIPFIERFERAQIRPVIGVV